MQPSITSRRGFLIRAVGLAAGTILAAGCNGQAPLPSQIAPTSLPTTTLSQASSTSPTPTQATTGNELLLNGAGSTFDYPLFSKVFAEYTKTHPTIKVNYQSIGSGGGVQQFSKGTVDFGATDFPMSDQQVTDAGNDVIHLPVTLEPV